MVLPTTTEEAEIDAHNGLVANSATPFATSNLLASVEERSVPALLRCVVKAQYAGRALQSPGCCWRPLLPVVRPGTWI